MPCEGFVTIHDSFSDLQRRVLACLRSWDQLSVFHFHLVDKLREVFIGKTHEEMEKQKAFVSVCMGLVIPCLFLGSIFLSRTPLPR